MRWEYDPKYLIPLDTHNPGNLQAHNKKKPEVVANALQKWQMTRGPKANIVGKDSLDNLMQVSLQEQDILNGLLADQVALQNKHEDLLHNFQVISCIIYHMVHC